MAKEYVGVIKGYSKHAGAMIVLTEDINKFCAVERQTDSQTKEIFYVAACDFRILEEMGLLKIDMLGVKVQDNIYDTLKYINSNIDIDNIPLDDAKTFDMLCEGYTEGVFQLSSKGMTELVKNIQPKHYRDLIPLVALYRPGCLNAKYENTNYSMVDMYVRRRQGLEPIKYLHPKLEPILSETYGVILYQEQIMKIVQSLCGYTLGQADILRRIIGKKKIEQMKPAMEKMIQCGIDNGIEPDIMRKIAQQIQTFAEYGFNQGHSAGYGKVAYQTAYLKANYPLQFMVCSINNRDSQDDILPYIIECKKMNIPLLPPDINNSKPKFTIEDDAIRIGLTYIKGVGNNLDITDISSFDAFSNNNNKGIVEALIKAGALDCFGKRVDMLIKLNNIDENITKTQQQLVDAEKRLNETINYIETTKRTDTKKYQIAVQSIDTRDKSIQKYKQKISELIQLQDNIKQYDEQIGEMEVLGFCDWYNCYDTSICNNKINICQITDIRHAKTKKGKPMAFITADFKGGKKDLVYFSKCGMEQYKVYYVILSAGRDGGNEILSEYQLARRK